LYSRGVYEFRFFLYLWQSTFLDKRFASLSDEESASYDTDVGEREKVQLDCM